MFILSQSTSYKWPVTVEFPVDGGKHEKQTFDAEFKRLSQPQIEAMRKRIEEGTTTDRELASDILTGWSGINDDKGDAVPYSEGAREQLLDIPLVAAAIVMSFITSLSGAKRKN